MQDRVAIDNTSLVGIKHWPIERMGHVTDQCACRIAGQLRVGIQSDDVLDRTQDGRITDNIRECSLLSSPQQAVELLQFAALALITHPHLFVWIPHPGPVKQVEDAWTVLTVGLVERPDSFARVGEKRIIIRQSLLRRVTEIRQQGKEQVGIAITKIADLQGLEKIINLLRTAKQGGDNHHGAVNGWYALRKIQSWQCPGRQHERDQQVHQRNDQRRDTDCPG